MPSGRKCSTLYSGRWTLCTGLWMLTSGHRTLDAGFWTLDLRRWTLNDVVWILDAGLWTRNSESWTLLLTDLGQNQIIEIYWKFFGSESVRTSWSRLFCREYRFYRSCFWNFYINVKYYLKEEYRSLSVFESRLKQLSRTALKQPSIVIHFRKVPQKIPVEASF